MRKPGSVHRLVTLLTAAALLAPLASAVPAQTQMLVTPPAQLPFDVVTFRVQAAPYVFAVGDRIAIPLCQPNQGLVQNLTPPRGGRADAGNCGWVNMPNGTLNPRGGNPPYHFKLNTMGGFPPFGLSVHPTTGFIEGVARWPGTRTFDVCAVDLSENWRCEPVTITINPKSTKRDDPKGETLAATSEPCVAVPAVAQALETVVSRVPEAERRAQQLLQEAREGRLAAQQELFSAFRSGLELFLQTQVKATADMTRAYTALPGTVHRSPEAEAWMRRLDTLTQNRDALEQMVKAQNTIEALPALVTALQANTADWSAFANFLQDTGLGDDAAVALASKLGSAKAIELTLQGLMIARDGLFAEFARRNAVADLENAQRALNALQAAGRNGANQASALRGPVSADCDRFDQLRQNTQSPSNAQTTPPKKGSAGKVLGGLILAGGAGVGAYYYADKALKDIGSTDSGSGSGGGSPSATFVSASTINCNVNAGGIVNNCTGTVTFDITGNITTGTTLRFQFTQGPGGNRTTTSNPAGRVSFTISGGTGGQTCPSLRSGTILFTATGIALGSFGSLPITVSCQ